MIRLILWCFATLLFASEPSSHFVSFIIPCYNCQHTVTESIGSIYQQDLRCPFEVICTNDGSSDHTEAVLLECAKRYPNLFVYSHSENKGGGAARNTCVKRSNGDLIFCLDSDNILPANSIQPLIDLMDATSSDVVALESLKLFSNNIFNRKGEYRLSAPTGTYDLYAWIRYPDKNPSFGGNYLYSRRSYNRAGGYPEDFGAMDTAGFGYRQLATGSVIRTLPGSFYWHRVKEDSYSRREQEQNRNALNHVKAIQYVSEIFSEKSQQLLLTEKNSDAIIAAFVPDRRSSKFQLASPFILESLFRAYNFREEQNYKAAAEEFEKAIRHGCNSAKISTFYQEMLEASSEALRAD